MQRGEASSFKRTTDAAFSDSPHTCSEWKIQTQFTNLWITYWYYSAPKLILLIWMRDQSSIVRIKGMYSSGCMYEWRMVSSEVKTAQDELHAVSPKWYDERAQCCSLRSTLRCFVVIPPSSINSLSCRVEIGTHRSSDIDMHMHTPQTGRAWSRETVGLLGFSLYKFSGGSRHSCPSYRILETFLVTYLCRKAPDHHLCR